MAKDRSAPFSLRHSRYFLPVTGGMLFIGGVNVAIGYWMQPTTPNPADNQRIELVIPVSTYKFDAPPSDAVASDAVFTDGALANETTSLPDGAPNADAMLPLPTPR